MFRKIEISVDTFALLWGARLPGENSEDEIIARLAGQGTTAVKQTQESGDASPELSQEAAMDDKPKSTEWVDVLVWALRRLGGCAPLADIYRMTRAARTKLGIRVTPHHEAAARERLESYCSDSENFKQIADLFYMPDGKGAGVWALRPHLPLRYQ